MLDMQPSNSKYGIKRWFAPTEAFQVYSFDIQLIIAEYALATFGVTSDEIRLMAIHLQPKCIEISLDTWFWQVNIGYNYDLLKLKEVAFLRLTYNPLVKNMASNMTLTK
jgi:hypothetical protein